MKKEAILVIVIVAALLGVFGFTKFQARQQAESDRESLKAQRAVQQSISATGRTPMSPAQNPGSMMARDLGLSEEQQKQMQALMPTPSAGGMAGRGGAPDMKKMEEMRKKMDAILTPEQKQKMASMMPPMMGGGTNR